MHKLINSQDIQQLIAGEQAAFKKVYDIHSQQVYKLAFHFLKNEAWSEEVVQESFLKLWINREKLDEAGNIWLYLYVITKRLSLNRLREVRQSKILLNQLFANIELSHNQTEELLMVNEMERFSEEIIANLPRQQQLIFKLSRIEGLSHKEIAEQLSISPNTVKNHMVEALKTLKRSFQYSGYIHSLVLCFWISMI